MFEDFGKPFSFVEYSALPLLYVKGDGGMLGAFGDFRFLDSAALRSE